MHFPLKSILQPTIRLFVTYAESLDLMNSNRKGSDVFLTSWMIFIEKQSYMIKEQLKPNITVFGCIYPIEIDEKLTDGIRLLKEEAAHNLYERYLDERQKQDLYYAKPVLFKGPPIHARYAIVEGVPSILPNKAQLPAVYQLRFKEEIKEWSILLLKKKEQDYSPEAEIDYDDFLHMIRAAKCPRFDASHLIVTYDDSLDEKVQQWKIRKGRERLILWLRKEHGPVADPPPNSFRKRDSK